MHIGAAVRAERVDAATLDKSGLPTQPADFTAVVVKLSKITFIMVSLYLNPGEGLQGSNADKLQQLLTWLRTRSMPWLIAGDWNHTPEQLSQSPWPAAFGRGGPNRQWRGPHVQQRGS